MKRQIHNFITAILSGLCISLGCVAFLKVGGIVGACLFTFGLLTVVHYGWRLYTGTAGFVGFSDFRESVGSLLFLVWVFIGNLIGCYLTNLSLADTVPILAENASKIVDGRLSTGSFGCMMLAVMCGFIMTTAVEFGKRKMFLPLLFGVPLFIMSGFAHSVADTFYFISARGIEFLWSDTSLLQVYLMEILGNFIGCNLWRFSKIYLLEP